MSSEEDTGSELSTEQTKHITIIFKIYTFKSNKNGEENKIYRECVKSEFKNKQSKLSQKTLGGERKRRFAEICMNLEVKELLIRLLE